MTEHSTVTRMAPGEANAQIDEALQGWAMSTAAPTSAVERPFDVLFVHGMASGGWMWSQEWLKQFTDAGYRTWTITLPGRERGSTLATDPDALDRALSLAFQQGNPEAALDALMAATPGAQLFDGPSLDDFANAIEDSISQIGRPTAIVCHSLGGAAAQVLLRRGKAPAATVLLASVPPYGLWRASMEMAVFNPALFFALWDFSLAGINPQNMDVMRANLFPNGITTRDFNALVPQLTDESLRAMSEAMGFPPFAPLPIPRDDVLVVGGSRDRFIPLQDLYATALYYGGLPKVISGAGHLMMQEALAPETADAILGYLNKRS
ncbi:MAG: alpha/beta fold hydrolase [Pseudomonadota bacterium]